MEYKRRKIIKKIITKPSFFEMMYCIMDIYITKLKLKNNKFIGGSSTNISVLKLVNLMTAYGVWVLLFPASRKDIQNPFSNPIGAIIIIFIVYALDYFFISLRKDVIWERFHNTTKKEKKKGFRQFWIYVSISIVSIIFIFYLINKRV